MSAPGDAARAASAADVDGAMATVPDAEQVAIVEAWIKAGDGERVAAVAAGEGASKNARKAAKKGVYVLKARGVAVAEPVRAPVASAATATAPSTESRGYMTKIDSSGVQVLMHVHSGRAGGGLQGGQAVVQRGKGLVDGGGIHLSRKELRAHLDALVDDGVRFYEVPADYVRTRIAAIVQTARDAGRVVPEGLLGVDMVLPQYEPVTAHPLEAKLPRSERGTGRVTEAALAVFETVPLLAAWGPDEDGIHGLLERMDGAGGGGVLVLTEAQKRDAAEEVFSSTVDAELGDRGAWAADLRDTAWCFVAEGDRDTAALLARCADELDDAARAPRDLAFARWLFRHQLVRHAEHHHPHKTPGGLYVP